MRLVYIGLIIPIGRLLAQEHLLLVVESPEVPRFEEIPPTNHAFHLTAPMTSCENMGPLILRTERTAPRSIREAPRQPVGSAHARLRFFRK